jgi:hypothetical protein
MPASFEVAFAACSGRLASVRVMKPLVIGGLVVGGAVVAVAASPQLQERLRSSVSTLRDAAVTLLRMNR